MATQNVNLSEQQAAFIRQSIENGDFRNASEVVRAGLRLLAEQQRADRLKLKVLRKMVKEGFDAIDRGEFETITAETIPDFVESLKRKSAKRTA